MFNEIFILSFIFLTFSLCSPFSLVLFFFSLQKSAIVRSWFERAYHMSHVYQLYQFQIMFCAVSSSESLVTGSALHVGRYVYSIHGTGNISTWLCGQTVAGHCMQEPQYITSRCSVHYLGEADSEVYFRHFKYGWDRGINDKVNGNNCYSW
jgi:hypothetical protein